MPCAWAVILLHTLNSGYSDFVGQFTRAVSGDIRKQLSDKEVELDPTPVADDVSARFLRACDEMRGKGIYPRLVFHGTGPENVTCIYRNGMCLCIRAGDAHAIQMTALCRALCWVHQIVGSSHLFVCDPVA